VLMLLDQAGICASSGSACTTGSLDPSHVLTAMSLTPMRARGSLRLSLGYYNTDADVDYLLGHLPPIIQRLRDISPLNRQHPDNVRSDPEGLRRKHREEMAKEG
jgi:cysteine desulfurase